MRALGISEHQCFVAGQSKVETGSSHPPAAQCGVRLRIEVDGSLPATLGGTFDQLGTFPFRPYWAD